MGRTASDVGTILYRHLKNSPLFSSLNKPNGVLVKDQRPSGSRLEDVVINVVSLDDEFIQAGEIEVFIFVPNLENHTANGVDKTQPNTARLHELSELAMPSLRYFYSDDMVFKAAKPFHYPCEPDANNQHYTKFCLLCGGPNPK